MILLDGGNNHFGCPHLDRSECGWTSGRWRCEVTLESEKGTEKWTSALVSAAMQQLWMVDGGEVRW